VKLDLANPVSDLWLWLCRTVGSWFLLAKDGGFGRVCPDGVSVGPMGRTVRVIVSMAFAGFDACSVVESLTRILVKNSSDTDGWLVGIEAESYAGRHFLSSGPLSPLG